MSHRIKRFAVFVFFACFCHFAAVSSIWGFYRHPIDTKTDHGNDKFESTGWIEILVSGGPPRMKGT